MPTRQQNTLRRCGLRTGTTLFLVAAHCAPAAHAQPAAPSNLAASPGDSRVTLSWDEPQAAVDRYEVRHGTGPAALGEWIAISGDAVEHTLPDLTNGTRYHFELRTVTSTGTSAAARASSALAAVPDAAVDVPDDRLHTLLAQALGVKASMAITQGQMATLTSFRAVGNNFPRSSPWRRTIVNLQGIEFAINATEMFLGGNNISDVAPLAKLTALSNLNLHRNEIADVAPLGELTSLRELVLVNNRIADVSPLAKLTELRYLSLLDNEIVDIAPLGKLTSLRTLVLASNRIADISPLEGMRLSYLDLDKNRISNLSPLTKMPLQFLGLDKNPIADISPLVQLPYLRTLDLGSASISDISPLAELPLESLHLDHNQIADISPLAEMTNLRHLDLAGNRISDVSPLGSARRMFWLNLADNGLADLSPLADLVEVRYLYLHNNAIADISPLAELPALDWLDLHNNRLADISPLAESTTLTRLHLGGNRIVDISALTQMTELAWLDLGRNRIADVAPLAGVTELWHLVLDHNEIADISPLGGWPDMRRLYLNHNAIVDVSALTGQVYGALVDLRGNPLGRAAVETQVPALRTSTGVLFDDGAHRVPFFPANGLVRVINHSDEAGEVRIWSTDEAGRRRGPRTLALGPRAAIQFNAADWRWGNAAKGLVGVGSGGAGDWRLTCTSPLDIEVLGYVRAPDGLLTTMHDLAPEAFDTHHVWMFNPGSNSRQASRLRLINPSNLDMRAIVYARDDAVNDVFLGRQVEIALPAHRTLDFTAAQLESGDAEGIVADGLGDGNGKWWLSVEAPNARVMSLLESPGGHLANVSSPIHNWPRRQATLSTLQLWGRENYTPEHPRVELHRIPLFPSPRGERQGFLRVIALANHQPTLALRAFDDSGRTVGPAMLRVPRRGSMHFNSNHLEAGSTAKGLPGTGASTGDWHLELRTSELFHVLGYARMSGGFVTSLHNVAPRTADGSLWVPFFQAAGDGPAQSTLRLVNWRDAPADIVITGIDDAGRSSRTSVRTTINPHAAVNFTAEQLETGFAAGLSGALGDGEGNWRLRVEAPHEVDAMSLLQLPTGELANLSTTPRYPLR